MGGPVRVRGALGGQGAPGAAEAAALPAALDERRQKDGGSQVVRERQRPSERGLFLGVVLRVFYWAIRECF